MSRNTAAPSFLGHVLPECAKQAGAPESAALGGAGGTGFLTNRWRSFVEIVRPIGTALGLMIACNVLLGTIAPEAAAQGTLVAPMNQARWLHTATLLPNGKVLVVGGFDGSGLSSAELYDPATSTWGSATSFPSPRFLHTATLLPGGRVLLLGGAPGILADAALYDPATATWGSATLSGDNYFCRWRQLDLPVEKAAASTA